MGNFKRYDGYVMHIPQEFIDSKLPVCPFCKSDNPHWLLDSKLEMSLAGSRTYYQCERCGAIISSTAADAGAEKGKSFAINPAMAAMNAAQKGTKHQEVGVAYMRVDDLGKVCTDHNLLGREEPITFFQDMAAPKKRFCTNCGTQIIGKASFCGSCGARVIPIPAAPAAEPAPVVQAAPVAQPAPVAEPAPVVQAAPVVQPAPVVQATPVVQPVPVVQSAPAATRPQTSLTQQPASVSGLAICLLILTGVALFFAILRNVFVLSPTLQGIGRIFTEYGGMIITNIFNRLIRGVFAFILPVIALIMNKKQGGKGAKALLIISIVVLAWQILAAIVYLILITTGAASVVARPFANTNGSLLFMNLWQLLRSGFRSLRNINMVAALFEGLCFTVKNILQIVLFAKLAKRN